MNAEDWKIEVAEGRTILGLKDWLLRENEIFKAKMNQLELLKQQRILPTTKRKIERTREQLIKEINKDLYKTKQNRKI